MRRPTPSAYALPALPVLFAAALALGGCLFDTQVAGGAEDFPNTVALGMTASQNLGEQSEWDQFSNMPAVDLAPSDSLVTAPLAKASAASAAKPADTCLRGKPDTTFDYSDTATLKVGRRIIRSETAVCLETDTTVFRWEDKLPLDRRGGRLIRGALGSLKAYRYENLDSAGGFDRGTFFDRNPKANGTVHSKLLITKPGPDGDFATRADNRPIYYGTLKTSNGDTLDAFDVSDADGDGELWGPNDSGLVNVRSLQTEPALRPAVARFSQAMRAVFFKQTGKTYPVAYLETRTDKNGRKVTFAVKGPRADSAFGPGDTVEVVVHTANGPEEDARFSEKTSRFRVLLSSDPWQFAKNKLLRFIMETRWKPGAFKKGLVTATRFTFTPDEPVTSGTLSVKGDVLIQAEFADGTTGSATGRFQDRRIEVDLEELKDGIKLRRFRIHWDATDGTVIRRERLPD